MHAGTVLTILNKLGMAFGTFDLDFSFSSGDPDLLSAAGAGINMMGLSLGHYILFSVKAHAQLTCDA